MFRATRPRLLAASGLAAVLALSACGSDTDSAGSMTGMSGHGPNSSTSSTSAASSSRAGDVMFAQMMVPHHRQALEMADVALASDAASGQVRTLAEQIKAAQDPEIQTMQGWLKEWGAPTTASLDHGSGVMMRGLSRPSTSQKRAQCSSA